MPSFGISKAHQRFSAETIQFFRVLSIWDKSQARSTLNLSPHYTTYMYQKTALEQATRTAPSVPPSPGITGTIPASSLQKLSGFSRKNKLTNTQHRLYCTSPASRISLLSPIARDCSASMLEKLHFQRTFIVPNWSVFWTHHYTLSQQDTHHSVLVSSCQQQHLARYCQAPFPVAWQCKRPYNI